MLSSGLVKKSATAPNGVKNLEELNHSLHMKFVHKLHEPGQFPRKTWFVSHAGSNFSGASRSYLDTLVADELPRYRSVTADQIGDGARTSFWHDHRLLDTTLAETFPALFSHCVRATATIHSLLEAGLSAFHRPC